MLRLLLSWEEEEEVIRLPRLVLEEPRLPLLRLQALGWIVRLREGPGRIRQPILVCERPVRRMEQVPQVLSGLRHRLIRRKVQRLHPRARIIPPRHPPSFLLLFGLLRVQNFHVCFFFARFLSNGLTFRHSYKPVIQPSLAAVFST
jgi:hypothetical protein